MEIRFFEWYNASKFDFAPFKAWHSEDNFWNDFDNNVNQAT